MALGDFAINLERVTSPSFYEGRTTSVKMDVACSQAYGIEREIFLYQVSQEVDAQGNNIAIFQNICSPADLTDFPVGDLTQSYPVGTKFRKAEVALIFRSRELRDQAWEAMQKDVEELIRTLELQFSGDAVVESVVISTNGFDADEFSSSSSLELIE